MSLPGMMSMRSDTAREISNMGMPVAEPMVKCAAEADSMLKMSTVREPKTSAIRPSIGLDRSVRKANTLMK